MARSVDSTDLGYEVGYDQITAGVTVSGTVIGSATTVIAGSSHAFDGNAVMMEFFAPAVTPGASGGVDFYLMEGATQIGVIGSAGPGGSPVEPFIAKYRFTPSAGNHTYSIVGVRSTANASVSAGLAGTGTYVPAYLRFVKA